MSETLQSVLFCDLKCINTCAVQVLYWVNIASYKAIRPLCPAAAQALASKTGTVWNKNNLETR